MSAPDGPPVSAIGPVAPASRLQDRFAVGIGFMLLGVLSFPLMNASVKFLTGFYPVLMIVCLRYVSHFLFTAAAFTPRYGWRLYVPSRPGMQLARSLLLLTSTGCYFFALTALPLTTAVTIGFTTPLIVTALSMPLLGEKVGIYRWSAVVLGFTGAVIIVQPWGAGPQADAGAVSPYLAAGSSFCSATAYSLYQILSRKLAAHDPPETSIVFTASVAVVITGIAALFVVDWAPIQAWWHILLFAATGFIGGFAHYFVTRAFVYAPAALLSPFGYGQLLTATALGYVIFGDFPDAWTWLGAAIVTASGLFITWREYLAARARNQL